MSNLRDPEYVDALSEVEPVPVDPSRLSDEEIAFMDERAGEVNYVVDAISTATLFREPLLLSAAVVLATTYFFRLGQEYAKQANDA